MITIPEISGFALDPSSLDKRGVSCGMGLDATIPQHVEYPEVAQPPQEVIDRVEDCWEEFGFKRAY